MLKTPLGRFARWRLERLDRPRFCLYGRSGNAYGAPCMEMVTLRESEAAGHVGYCGHEHDGAAQAEALM